MSRIEHEGELVGATTCANVGKKPDSAELCCRQALTFSLAASAVVRLGVVGRFRRRRTTRSVIDQALTRLPLLKDFGFSRSTPPGRFSTKVAVDNGPPVRPSDWRIAETPTFATERITIVDELYTETTLATGLVITEALSVSEDALSNRESKPMFGNCSTGYLVPPSFA
jgi:hypothetical protein